MDELGRVMEFIGPALGLAGLIYGMHRASMFDWLQSWIGPGPVNAYRTPILYGYVSTSSVVGIGDGTTVTFASEGFKGDCSDRRTRKTQDIV